MNLGMAVLTRATQHAGAYGGAAADHLTGVIKRGLMAAGVVVALLAEEWPRDL